ncbi:MAG: hypothetical protein AVDCRST_MAG74-3565 [uncultured Pyrinomonadaceae bacterium]|uniref:Uncharacterized protein n=1 Tax=uncultured Pyrinomonadaceae bacterium TaxID=2283094 RepID=A0A6J4PYE6_9BACT|nr:MAG: hypothetical protein AVDCRST_MAG74-3565 [uncultured Pyrinomonadaceae bacterium]
MREISLTEDTFRRALKPVSGKKVKEFIFPLILFAANIRLLIEAEIYGENFYRGN